MNPADDMAPLAIHVLLVLGLILLAIELLGCYRRRRARQAAELHQVLWQLGQMRTRPPRR